MRVPPNRSRRARGSPHVRVSKCPTDIRLCATISAPRCARPSPPLSNTSCHPTGSRSRVTTATPRYARPPPRTRTCSCPTASRLHSNSSSCPLLADASQSLSFRDRRPHECRCFSVFKYPSFTASSSIISDISRPVAVTASRISRLTGRNRARSIPSRRF